MQLTGSGYAIVAKDVENVLVIGGANGPWYLNASTVRQDKELDDFLGDVGDDWFWGQFPVEVNDRTGTETAN